MRTVGDAISSAREILQDEDSTAYRYSDASLTRFFTSWLSEVRRVRPDLFLTGKELPVYTAADFTEVFPVNETVFQSSVYFISGNAELRDDEFSADGRAMSLITRSTSMLTGT